MTEIIRGANGQSHKFHYDAENRQVTVTNLAGTIEVASFEYDADGARVKSVMDGETIVLIGSHCEIANPGTNQIFPGDSPFQEPAGSA